MAAVFLVPLSTLLLQVVLVSALVVGFSTGVSEVLAAAAAAVLTMMVLLELMPVWS